MVDQVFSIRGRAGAVDRDIATTLNQLGSALYRAADNNPGNGIVLRVSIEVVAGDLPTLAEALRVINDGVVPGDITADPVGD